MLYFFCLYEQSLRGYLRNKVTGILSAGLQSCLVTHRPIILVTQGHCLFEANSKTALPSVGLLHCVSLSLHVFFWPELVLKDQSLISSVFCFLQTLFARALFDNTAETEDELAFRKGEIITVLERNVVGSIGWWKCSLHGRQGLAPANRLAPLSPAEAEKLCLNLSVQKDYLSNHSHQNIYQTPKATRPPENHIYEDMTSIYKVPLQANPSPDKHMPQEDPERTRSPHEVSLSAHILLLLVSFMFYAIISSFVWIWLSTGTFQLYPLVVVRVIPWLFPQVTSLHQ